MAGGRRRTAPGGPGGSTGPPPPEPEPTPTPTPPPEPALEPGELATPLGILNVPAIVEVGGILFGLYAMNRIATAWLLGEDE